MKTYLGRFGLFMLLTVAIGLAGYNRQAFSLEAITTWVEGLGFWGPLVFVGIYSLAPALFLPGSVITLAGGALFGPITGALLSLIGATIGATVAFLIARYLAADSIERRAAGRLQEIKAGVEREGWRFVAFARLVPIFPFNLLNYALGLTRLPIRTYTITSLVTMIPGALAYAYLGYAGREAISGGPDLVRKILLAVTLLAAVALLPSLIRRWRRPGFLKPHHLHMQLSQAAPFVLDVRNPDEFSEELGHIKESVLMPLPELDRRLAELAPYRTQTIIAV